MTWLWDSVPTEFEEREAKVVEASGKTRDELWTEVTGLPVWWDHVGREWSNAKRKWSRYIDRKHGLPS